MADQAEALRKAMWAEANRIRVDAIYSGRGHQVVAQRWSLISKLGGLPAAMLGGTLCTTAALTALLRKGKAVTATLALTGVVLVAARAFLRPVELAHSHSLKGTECMDLASDATHFQGVALWPTEDPERLKSHLDQLVVRLNSLRLKAPRHIPRSSYRKAKMGIVEG